MPFRNTTEGGDLCAIFVHAGAGYHSTGNEKIHLGACNDAARVAMAILKNGGEAADAVEMAIRLLEDREITNAGYGSNLTMDGQVECDACIVDHFGRSGAVGAISNVRNPIAVARLVLQASIKPLSLSRVPPNLLVGPGAADFAYKHGVHTVPAEMLISETSQARWENWKKDLKKAEDEERQRNGQPAYHSVPGTPITPPHSVSPPATSHTTTQHPLPHNISKHANPDNVMRKSVGRAMAASDRNDPEEGSDPRLAEILGSARKRVRTDGSIDDLSSLRMEDIYFERSDTRTLPTETSAHQDRITDTVGAIAIDCYGRIAAGSSSGGIGMKHRGRCGPAALVGISTAVIPADEGDPRKASVATITSGTGEHMATTAAAHTAADRVLSCTKKVKGRLVQCSEDEALSAVIQNDFMKHPGVQSSPCQGAIGILAVKKMRHGIFFYFAHNTDSFAIASMHSDERRPVCVMSRSKESGMIAQGARKARARGAKGP